jgi:hypothetical protein
VDEPVLRAWAHRRSQIADCGLQAVAGTCEPRVSRSGFGEVVERAVQDDLLT